MSGLDAQRNKTGEAMPNEWVKVLGRGKRQIVVMLVVDDEDDNALALRFFAKPQPGVLDLCQTTLRSHPTKKAREGFRRRFEQLTTITAWRDARMMAEFAQNIAKREK